MEDAGNSENIAPVLFSKRSKGPDLWNDLHKSFTKPSAFTLTKAAPSPAFKDVLGNPPSTLSSARPRSILQPKSPAARLQAKAAAPAPVTAPAGRSPTRASKRMGILSRRRTRLDPPSFSLGGATVPFSLDAALKGSIPSYSGSIRRSSKIGRSRAAAPAAPATAALDFFFPTSDRDSAWCFDIHEDTPEQEMTNLLQHGTCTLDISSDEESESRAKRDRAEGRDKENIPPPEDVSQTSAARGASADAVEIDEDVLLLKGRGPLAEMNVTDFYADGCDGSSVFIVPGDEEDPEAVVEGERAVAQSAGEELAPLQEEDEEPEQQQQPPQWPAGDDMHQPQVSLDDVERVDVDDIMGGNDQAAEAAGLGPIEGAGESFELWESNSAKDEGDAPASPAPVADDESPQAGFVF